jgi:RNA polymerase sigma factor (sigma-70 family)
VSATATGDHEARVDARPRRHRLPASLLRLASDERLVELLRGGSEAAFEALYARHHRGVLAFCRHMLGSAEEAEDAVQHTFLAAYGDLVGSGKDIHLRPWLYAIARNRCLTALRARREGGSGEPVEPSTEHLSLEVERRHELRELLGDLAGLPDDQRAALVLAELGDMSHDEIGQALGCRREKVKALVFQARSSLIASRDAREASCSEVREQLANLRGGALRRNLLRRHLRECAGCREFRDRVQAQRRDLALILPVAPSLGLQAAVLGGGAAATSSVVAKTVIVLALAGGGATAVETVREDRQQPDTARAPAVAGAVEGADAAGPVPQAPTVRRGEATVGWPPRAGGPKPIEARPPKARGRKPVAAGRARRSREHVPPGQAWKPGDRVRPGQAKKPVDRVRPGQAKRSVERVRPEQANRSVDRVPPPQANRPVDRVPPEQANKTRGAIAPADGPVAPGRAKTADDVIQPGQAKKQ